MKTYQADINSKLLELIEQRVKEKHLPIHLQYSLPYATDGGLMHTVTIEYPDDFDLNQDLLAPAANKLMRLDYENFMM